VCGQQASYYDLCPGGKTGMILVMFRPYGAGVFFKMPMLEISDQNVALEQLAGIEAKEIEDRILNAANNQERIQLIEKFLTNKLIRNHHDQQQVKAVLYRMMQSRGQISIKELAETACLSVKQLERKFSGSIGLNPKQFIRIVRFQHVLKIHRNGFTGSLTSLAHESGYYDQAHFIHDFKRITGSAPRKFFYELQPNAGSLSVE
jgi:AraC-like DNA-binding protein